MLIQDVECIVLVFRLLLEPGRQIGERQERPQLSQQYLEVVSFFVRRDGYSAINLSVRQPVVGTTGVPGGSGFEELFEVSGSFEVEFES